MYDEGVVIQLLGSLDDEPVLSPSDPGAEVRFNTRWVSRSDAEAPPADAVERRLVEVAETWLGKCSDAATFYAWYDEQAGQLRFSLSSARPEDLPFGATVRLLTDPSSIVATFLADPHPGVIFLEELADVSDEDEKELSAYELPVWAVRKN